MNTQQVMINPPIKDDGSESSEWSLSSLEELKGLSLAQMRDDENDEKPPGSQHPKSQKPIEITYPPKQKVIETTQLYEIGKIIFKVDQIIVVQAISSEKIVDLNNCLFDHHKNCIGFVMDVLGRVDNPFYAVKQFPKESEQTINLEIGTILCYAEGCKTVTQQDIKSLEDKHFVDCDIESSSSDEQDREEQFSQKQQSKKHFNFNNRKRKASVEERPNYRERTRDNKGRRLNNNSHNNNYNPNYNNSNPNYNNNNSFGYPNMNQTPMNQMPMNQMSPNNQQYLNNVYAQYYQQMMQMQNGTGQFVTPPPPPFFPQNPPK